MGLKVSGFSLESLRMWVVIIFIFVLPALVLAFSFYQNNFNVDYIKTGLQQTTGISGFEALPKLEFEGEPSLCGDAIHLGYNNVMADCSSKCGSDYEYIFIEKNKSIIINKVKLFGAYCIKKELAKCNLNTSMAIVGLGEYKCLTNFPTILSGKHGRTIVACNGKLKDNLHHTIYENNIPSNLTLSSEGFDERLEDGSFRFTCPEGLELPKTIATRLETETNVCSLLDRNGTVDFNAGVCNCPLGHINPDNPASICTACQGGFAHNSGIYGWKYGYTVAKDCIDPTTFNAQLVQHVKFVCGERSLGVGETCMKALLPVTNTYSPMALQTMYG